MQAAPSVEETITDGVIRTGRKQWASAVFLNANSEETRITRRVSQKLPTRQRKHAPVDHLPSLSQDNAA